MASTKINPTRKPTQRPAKTLKRAKPGPVGNAQDGSAEDMETQPNIIRRKEMIERIVASSGLKPNVVKSVLDAVLEELGKALSAGEGLHLEPLGKIKVNRQIDQGDAQVLVCKIRRRLPVSALDTAAE